MTSEVIEISRGRGKCFRTATKIVPCRDSEVSVYGRNCIRAEDVESSIIEALKMLALGGVVE